MGWAGFRILGGCYAASSHDGIIPNGIPPIRQHALSRTAFLDTCDPAQRSSLQRELSDIKQTAHRGVAFGRANATNMHWDLWVSFCVDLHCNNPDASPFRLRDAHLLINSRRLDPYTATDFDLSRVNYVALEFTTQKNRVRGELVGLGRSGHPTWCPVQALLNRVRHLRLHRAPTHTPLYSFFDQSWQHITTTILTHYLRQAVITLGTTYGIASGEVSVRSLRSSGAMSLLCARVDTDMIRLLGWWRSDEMLRYLHVQTFPLVAPLALQMLHHGNFTMIPNIPGG